MTGNILDKIEDFTNIWTTRIMIAGLVAVAFLLMLAAILQYHRKHHGQLSGLKKRLRHAPKGKLKILPRRFASGIVFGKTPLGWRVCSPASAEGSIFATGGSGSGKTAGFLIPTLRATIGKSTGVTPKVTALVVDISGDIQENVEVERKAVIAPEGKGDGPWDILHAVDNASTIGEKHERLEQLAFALIPDRPTSDDTSAFYLEESRKLLLCSLVAYYFADSCRLDFVDICKQIMGVSAEFLLADINASGNKLAIALAAGFEGGNEKTLAATKQEVDKAISLFATNEKISACIMRGCRNPKTLEHMSLFLNIPDEKLEIFSPFLRLVVSQTLHYLSARENGKKPTILLCLDEFASFGKMDILPALRKLRKKNVRLIVLTQSLADLDLIYGKDERRAMLDNFAFKVVLLASEVDTQRYFSDLAGDITVQRKTITRRPGFDAGAGSESYSESEYRDKLIQPKEFGLLEKHLVLYHSAGIMLLRKNYFFNTFFARIKRFLKWS